MPISIGPASTRNDTGLSLCTADAVTPMPHLTVPFVTFSLLYLVLGVTVVVLLRRQVFAAPEGDG